MSFILLDHPLIKHKLTLIRNKDTKMKDFYQNVEEIAGLMAYEITRNFPLKEVEISTPICSTVQHELALDVVIVPIFPETITKSIVLVVDPMLATGGSASAAISMLKMRGCKDIRYIGLVGAPEGVELLQKKHPDVDIYLAALDKKLNDNGYIVPGLGDCGDRLFGTK